MKIFLDTSVLVAAVVQNHNRHTKALSVLERVQTGQDTGFVSAHSLAEMFAVLSKLPPPSRHTPEQALLSIEENVAKYFTVSWLTGTEYIALLRKAALAGIQGGTIYDAVLLECAGKASVERIFTFNVRHFQMVAPKDISASIIAP